MGVVLERPRGTERLRNRGNLSMKGGLVARLVALHAA